MPSAYDGVVLATLPIERETSTSSLEHAIFCNYMRHTKVESNRYEI